MRLPQLADLPNLTWFPFSDDPVIDSMWYAPRLCDPQFLMPEEAPDERWHLFCHSQIGIHSFVSDSGIVWKPVKMLQVRAHSPFIYTENGTFYMLYEKHTPPIPFLNSEWTRRRLTATVSASHIEMRTSKDLLHWSEPILLLEGSAVPFAGDYLKRNRVSRPQLFRLKDGRYRLYFGAGHLDLADSRQRVSRYFAAAEAPAVMGPYTLINNGRPLFDTMPDDPYRNLGAGSVRIIQGEDGFAAFECGAYWNPVQRKSAASMILLTSRDGLDFNITGRDPIIRPADKGWADRYIMSCDVRYSNNERCWYCFFSANTRTRGGHHTVEQIGLLIGENPNKNKLRFLT